METKLLIPEPPLQVLPSLAVAIGLNEAIVLQQLHYWLNKSKHEEEGHRWVYNSYESWHLHFPFWSICTIKRIIHNLEKQGLVISGNFNVVKMDKTKWYRIDYEKIQSLYQVDTTIVSSCTNHSSKLTQALPENTTENNTDTNVSVSNSTKNVEQDAHIAKNINNKLSALSSLWNEICKSLPQVRESSKKRHLKESVRITERPIEEWKRVFEKIEASDFCKGTGSTTWRATYDWIINSQDNAIKVLEGKYDNLNKEILI